MGRRRDERKQKRREKYARIRESVHGKTERSLTRFFLWIRLDRIGAKILNWAEGHRRGMFAITIAFLSCVAALCLWVRPKIGPRQVYDSIRTDSIRNPTGRAGMTNPLDDLDLRVDRDRGGAAAAGGKGDINTGGQRSGNGDNRTT